MTVRIFYSAEAGGFFHDHLHAVRPADAVEISPAHHAALLAGQAKGQRIAADADGRPALADHPAPPRDHQWALLRRRRDALLAASDWTQLADAPRAGRAAWAAWRQQLRDLPATVTDPAAVQWPERPGESQ